MITARGGVYVVAVNSDWLVLWFLLLLLMRSNIFGFGSAKQRVASCLISTQKTVFLDWAANGLAGSGF